VQALVHEQMCRQNAQFGHRFPRAGSMESANPVLLLLLHFCNNLWKTGIAEEEAVRLLEAKGGTSAVLCRSSILHRFFTKSTVFSVY
jgi:hypothetical protein